MRYALIIVVALGAVVQHKQFIPVFSFDDSIATSQAQNFHMIGAPLTEALLNEQSLANNLPSTKLTDTDILVLADFKNGTDDEILSGTLQQPLRTALEESPFLSVLSAGSVAAILKDAAMPIDTPLTPKTTGAMCTRANAKAYISGSITKEGSEFAISLKVTECASGRTLAQERATPQDKDKILDSLEEVVAKVRVQLGEPPESVRKFTTALPRATSASLEALRAWSAGVRAQQEKGDEAAVPLLATAINLDPNFASALFRLGLIYRNSGREERARELWTRAFAVGERASTREKFNVAGAYYSFVTVDYGKAVETYRQWIKAYPRDEKPVLNLGSFYGDVCEYDQAITQFTEARRMNPRNAIAHEDLIEILTATGQFGKAHEAYQEMQRMKLDTDAVHVFMYSVAALEHDPNEMVRQAAWFDDKPQFQHEILSEEADAEAFAGHLDRARQLTKQAVQSGLHADNREQAAGWQLNSAWREDLFGNAEVAHEQALQALTIAPDSRENGAVVAILLARTGDLAKASAIADELEKRYPLHAIVQSYWLPSIRAQIALASKQPALALQQLDKAKRYDILFPQVTWYSHMPSVVLRAEAYAALDQPDLAAKEWQTILQYPGIVQLSATAPIAKLQIAHISLHQAGVENSSARNSARSAYQDFLSLWSDADPDIPILKEARAQFAQLQ